MTGVNFIVGLVMAPIVLCRAHPKKFAVFTILYFIFIAMLSFLGVSLAISMIALFFYCLSILLLIAVTIREEDMEN